MKRYRPSGRFSFGGFILLILATIVGSLVIGGIAFAASHLIYLVILFPLLMGLAAGVTLTWVVRTGKVRSPLIAGIFGLLMGIGIIGTVHFLDYYITERNDYRSFYLKQENPKASQDEIDKALDKFLAKQTGSAGFIGDLRYNAQQGITLTQQGSSSSDIKLDENATWIYWGIELAIVMLIAAFMAMSAARKPFDEEAGKWYPVGKRIGSVDWESRKDFYRQLRDGDTTEAFKMVTRATSQTPRVDLVAQQTPDALQSDVILAVKETRLNRRREISADKLKAVLSPQEFADLARTLGLAQPPQPASPQWSKAAESLE